MAFFDWQDQYSVHIQEIDTQHKKLVALLNEIYEALKKGEGREALGKILAELIQYTKTHFATEERLMATHGYPDYITHKEKHEKMALKVLDYSEKFKDGKISNPIEISNFLKNWLGKHIMETDKKYGPFLNDKGVR